MPSQPLPPKKDVALALLERSDVFIHLDPRVTGVVVPPWLKNQPRLSLRIGLNMPVPIPDLRVDEDGMTCTLSFNRSPFFCVVPWKSVYAMEGEDGRGMIWQDDIPPELVAPSPAAEPARPTRQETPRLVESRSNSPATSSNSGTPAAKGRKSRKKQPAPALAVTPKHSESESGAERPRPAPILVGKEQPKEPQPSPTRSGSGQRKPKRELPPYLRIVK